MKPNYRFLMITVLLILCTTCIYAQEVAPFKGSFEACKAQAQKENKLILIDLYFVGCMPCAEMDEKVFPDPAVAKEIASNYIVFKTDVMKEMDGKKLARKYGASGFPTFVLLNGAGKALLTEAGYFGDDRFVSLLQKGKALEKQRQYLAFDTNLDHAYPAAYSERFIKTGEQHDFAELESYLAQQKDLTSETAFLANTVTNFPRYTNWIYDHLPQLIDLYDGSLLLNKVNTIAKLKSKQFGGLQQVDSLRQLLSYIRPVYNERMWSVFLPIMVTSYYEQSRDAARYLQLMDEYDLYPNWDLRSNALGQVIFSQKQQPAILKSILKEFLEQQKKGALDIPDQYKLVALYLYLQDFDQAQKAMDVLLKSDFSDPYLATKKADIEQLKQAIANKNTHTIQVKDIKKSIPVRLG